MKIRLLLTCMLAMTFGLQTRAQDTESETSGKYPAITFEKTTHNFGLFDKAMYFERVPKPTKIERKARSAENGVWPLT